ncbi:MAG: HAD-IA family hydrolase [Bacteroides sp.]|nr:HAD-IA family hydrolase [Bacteroides sp.]MCM1413057.1 HAD-IA family hydrolase [Bacteroides sp.]MCM1471763.1 HAD-IA family hydrolase [Bacteroides sp.]
MTSEEAVIRYLQRNSLVEFTPRAALIDMDGTLYDSMPSHARAWKQMMSEVGVEVPLEEFFLYEGRTGASTINILFNRSFGRDATAEEAARLYHRKTELFSAMPPVKPMPGAAAMLDFLKMNGVECVLVTGSGQASLIQRLERDYPGTFTIDHMITGRNVKFGKPDPEPYLKAMQLIGRKPGECIVIENAPLGVESGHASGAFTVGVNTGPIPIETLCDAGADIVYDSMNQFADNLPLLFSSMGTTKNNI